MLCLIDSRLPPSGGAGIARKPEAQFGQIGRGKVAAIIEVVVGSVDGCGFASDGRGENLG